MVIKIHKGSSIDGPLMYNFSKQSRLFANILAVNNMPSATEYSDVKAYFEDFVKLSGRVKNPIFTASINPTEEDLERLTDEELRQIGEDYMQQMGYEAQPFIIFKHTDIERTHIHIVSVRVDGQGRKIDSNYENVKSSRIRRYIEKRYGLEIAQKASLKEERRKETERLLKTKNVLSGAMEKGGRSLTKEIRSSLRYIVRFDYHDFTTYNALLSIYGIKAEKVQSAEGSFEGIVYYLTNEKGERISNAIKGSDISKDFTYGSLLKDFELRTRERQSQSREAIRNQSRKNIAYQINRATERLVNEEDFKKLLRISAIETKIYKRSNGDIYGMSFIDTVSGCIFKASEIGKEYSAVKIKEKFGESKGRVIRSEERGELYKVLSAIYNEKRRDYKTYHYETQLIDSLNTFRKQMLDTLVSKYPDILIGEHLYLIDSFIKNKTSERTKISEKEYSYFTKQVREYTPYLSYLDRQKRTEFFVALGFNISKDGISAQKKEEYRIPFESIGMEDVDFREIENTDSIRHLTRKERTILSAIIAGNLENCTIDHREPQLNLFHYLTEKDKKALLREMEYGEIKRIVSGDEISSESVSKLLSKGYIIKPVYDPQTHTSSYVVGHYKGDNVFNVTPQTAKYLDSIDYKDKLYGSVCQIVYNEKSGKVLTNYDFTVQLSRTNDITDKTQRERALDVIIDRVEEYSPTAAARIKQIRQRGGSTVEMAAMLSVEKLGYKSNRKKSNIGI